ncbi:MAG: hypothetical protein ABJN65_02045 [Parasphingorhabdus sp.]
MSDAKESKRYAKANNAADFRTMRATILAKHEKWNYQYRDNNQRR